MHKKVLSIIVAICVTVGVTIVHQTKINALDGFGTTRLALLDSHNRLPSDPDTTPLGYSGDGRYLFFFSRDNSLIPDDTSQAGSNIADYYRRDTISGAIDFVNRDSQGSQTLGWQGGAPVYNRLSTTDGRYVPFIDGNGCYIRDMLMSRTQTVYQPVGVSDSCKAIVISADGRYASFGADMPGETFVQIYLYDILQQTYNLISKDALGQSGYGNSELKNFSADGTKIMYHTQASNLGPEPHQPAGTTRILQYDTQTATDRAFDDITNHACQIRGVSDDANRFALTCSYADLPDGIKRQGAAYYEVADGSIASIASPAVMSDQSGISAGDISPDGTKIALQYLEDNDVNTYDVNNNVDGAIFDVATGSITLTGVSSSGVQGNLVNSLPWGFSHDGSRYVFNSTSTNLTSVKTNLNVNWFEHYAEDGAANPTYDFTAPRVSKLALDPAAISSTQSSSISVKATDHYGIERVEYYIDAEPDRGNGTVMNAAPHNLYSAVIPSGLSTGTHTVYVRAVDTSNNWSQIMSMKLTVL